MDRKKSRKPKKETPEPKEDSGTAQMEREACKTHFKILADKPRLTQEQIEERDLYIKQLGEKRNKKIREFEERDRATWKQFTTDQMEYCTGELGWESAYVTSLQRDQERYWIEGRPYRLDKYLATGRAIDPKKMPYGDKWMYWYSRKLRSQRYRSIQDENEADYKQRVQTERKSLLRKKKKEYRKYFKSKAEFDFYCKWWQKERSSDKWVCKEVPWGNVERPPSPPHDIWTPPSELNEEKADAPKHPQLQLGHGSEDFEDSDFGKKLVSPQKIKFSSKQDDRGSSSPSSALSRLSRRTRGYSNTSSVLPDSPPRSQLVQRENNTALSSHVAVPEDTFAPSQNRVKSPASLAPTDMFEVTTPHIPTVAGFPFESPTTRKRRLCLERQRRFQDKKRAAKKLLLTKKEEEQARIMALKAQYDHLVLKQTSQVEEEACSEKKKALRKERNQRYYFKKKVREMSHFSKEPQK